MLLKTILFFVILTTSKLCSGQSTFDKVEIVNNLGNNIMLVYQDKKNNNFWFGSHQDGIYKYDGTKIIHYTTKNGLPHNRIEEIKEDKFGNIYFNTNNGISKFDGFNFTTLNEASTANSKWKLNKDDVWFKSPHYSGQVYRYDGKMLYKLQLPKIKLGETYIAKYSNHPNPYGVYTIYNDSKGNIWFGTATLGACRYNGKIFNWISEEDVTEIHNGPANGVRSIIEDKDGYFWFNTIYRYNIYNVHTQPFYSKEKGIGSLDGKKNGNLNEYLSIAKDNNNDLWIATYNAGVWQYNGKKITQYAVQDDGKNITLFSIYNDNNGCLWLGTHSNGVFKFNGKTFEKFNP